MKNTNFRKVLSILLAIMMMASTCALTFSVSAEDTEAEVVYTYDYSQTPTYTPATCTEYGYNTYVSNEDDDVTIDVTIDADEPTGHTFDTENLSEDDYTPATCTEDSYYTVTCADCDETTKVAGEATATGHSYGDVEVVTESSCTVAGSGTQECSECKDVITVELELAAHTFNVYKYTIEGNCCTNAFNVVGCYYCDATEEQEVADSMTGVCVDADGNDICDNCYSLIEGSFWDQLIRFILDFFEIIASWFE